MMEFSVKEKSILRPLYEMRTRITEDIFLNFDLPEAALVNALVTGSKDEMPETQKENYRRAGVYHIIAVSGLHLGLLLMFLFASVSSVKLKSFSKKLLSLAITFAGGIFLMVFTGFGISVQRAAFMALFLCVAGLVSRDYSPMSSLFCVLAVVIVWTGMLILDRQTLRKELVRLHVVAASDSDEDQQAATDPVDEGVMALDPPEGGFQIIDEESADEERDSQAQRIGQKHTHALQHVPLLRSQHQGASQEGSHAGSPANGEDQSKKKCVDKIHVTRLHSPTAALKQV
jgi:hypothetical protein